VRQGPRPRDKSPRMFVGDLAQRSARQSTARAERPHHRRGSKFSEVSSSITLCPPLVQLVAERPPCAHHLANQGHLAPPRTQKPPSPSAALARDGRREPVGADHPRRRCSGNRQTAWGRLSGARRIEGCRPCDDRLRMFAGRRGGEPGQRGAIPTGLAGGPPEGCLPSKAGAQYQYLRPPTARPV
jgi:hypothetical protein